jgi:hypothetical protein
MLPMGFTQEKGRSKILSKDRKIRQKLSENLSRKKGRGTWGQECSSFLTRTLGRRAYLKVELNLLFVIFIILC